MPNWVMNKLTFTGDENDIKELLNSIQGPEDCFDFNTIIPMPEDLQVESGSITKNSVMAVIIRILESKELGYFVDTRDIILQLSSRFHSRITETSDKDPEVLKKGLNYISNLINYGHMTWYDWCIEHWGTKWNACGATMVDDHTIIFRTAWSAPHPVIEELAKAFQSVNITHEWADEDIGNNCGSRIYINGEANAAVRFEGGEGGADAILFAKKLWEYDDEDN